MEVDKLLPEVENVLREAGAKMLSMVRPKVYTKEGHANYVTEGDLAIQTLVMERLARILPGSLFYAEEKEENTLTDEPTWIIDPIDGTANFIRGCEHSCISAALAQNRETVMGLIYNPYRHTMYTAIKGQGAWRDGERITVSSCPFDRALVRFGSSPYQPRLAHATVAALEEFLHSCGDVRRLGSAALDLCAIAEGSNDIFFEYRLSPWDYAAGMLLVTEAGGICTSTDGSPLEISHPMGVLAASPACYEGALAICRKHLEDVE